MFTSQISFIFPMWRPKLSHRVFPNIAEGLLTPFKFTPRQFVFSNRRGHSMYLSDVLINTYALPKTHNIGHISACDKVNKSIIVRRDISKTLLSRLSFPLQFGIFS